jgi:hypothetical protein
MIQLNSLSPWIVNDALVSIVGTFRSSAGIQTTSVLGQCARWAEALACAIIEARPSYLQPQYAFDRLAPAQR